MSASTLFLRPKLGSYKHVAQGSPRDLDGGMACETTAIPATVSSLVDPRLGTYALFRMPTCSMRSRDCVIMLHILNVPKIGTQSQDRVTQSRDCVNSEIA